MYTISIPKHAWATGKILIQYADHPPKLYNNRPEKYALSGKYLKLGRFLRGGMSCDGTYLVHHRLILPGIHATLFLFGFRADTSRLSLNDTGMKLKKTGPLQGASKGPQPPESLQGPASRVLLFWGVAPTSARDPPIAAF